MPDVGADVFTAIATGVGAALGFPGVGAAAGGLVQALSGDTEAVEKAQVEEVQATSDISTYQSFLNNFSGYASAKESAYSTEEAQTLSDRLASMGMKGQSGAGGTSAGGAFTAEKSLWDQGYTQLVNSLTQEQTKAQGELNVAEASLTEAKSTEAQNKGLFGQGGFLGLGFA